MSASEHERAREAIALSGAEDLSGQQQTWLREHLRECVACRDYAEAAGRVVRALHSEPLILDSDLVQTTKMLLRSRAMKLRQQQERLWLVCLSCSFVGVSAAITTPLFWRVFALTGAWVGLPGQVWQAGFALFWIAPALFVGTILLARGTHLTNSREMQWR